MLSLPAPVRDAALLLARIAIGVIFLAHGWQKFFTNGIDGTTRFFTSAGVPVPGLSAWAATVLELVGGGALVLGVAVPVVGVLLALDMLGAFFFVHAGKGIFVAQGGWELVLALGVTSLLLAALGAGRLSVDHALFGRRSGTRTPQRV
ncbi:MAG: DoxX family protein [Actinomycetota bacterium]|nr:DoxX family protein [Actinomycetota bacterium]